MVSKQLVRWVVALSALVSAEILYGAEAITVNLATNGQQAISRYTGFLQGIDGGSIPQDSVVLPLKPKAFRCIFSNSNCIAVHTRATAMGATHIQWLLSDFYGYRSTYPGDGGSLVGSAWVGGDYTRWNTVVHNIAVSALNAGKRFEWDIWNEPDGAQFWGRSQEQLYAAWHQAAIQIRAVDPTAVLVGPSYGQYIGNGSYTKAFLLAQQAYGLLPDVVSWHEICLVLNCDGELDVHVADMRAFLAAHGMSQIKISINETTGSLEQFTPGPLAIYFAKAERAVIDSMMHSCWDDGFGFTCQPLNLQLDGLLTADAQTPPKSPRAVWWATKGYADITGTIVSVNRSLTVDAVAGKDAGAKIVRLLVGRVGVGTIPVTINLTNVTSTPYVLSGDRVRITAQRIPGASNAAWPQPPTVLDATYTMIGGQVSITVDMGEHDAYTIQVTAPGVTRTPRPLRHH
jgi:hypothetical protein